MSVTELILVGVGGIIGAGFFLGSGVPIRTAGPSVLLAFFIGGLITAQVVGAFSSVSLDDPEAGAFKAYADKYLGRYLGYMQGWVYYVASILTISSEAVASAIFVQVWLPSIPLWSLSSGFALLILLINAFGVKNFGRVESWMSVVKIAALVGFIVVAAIMLFGLHPHTMSSRTSPASGLFSGGFFPHGIKGLFQSMLIVIFAYAGIGVFATATIELKNPKKLDVGGITTISVLTGLYVLSILFLLLVLPWNQASTKISPFVEAFHHANLTVLGDILNGVILVASFSVMAGSVFSANQILQSLAKGGEAPKFATKVSKKRETPYGSLAITAVGLAIFIGLSYILPSQVYNFLISASSFFTFFTYFIICMTFLYWRRKRPKQKVSRLAFFQPWSTVITMAAILFLTGYAMTVRDERLGFYACIVVSAILSIGYLFTRKHRQHG